MHWSQRLSDAWLGRGLLARMLWPLSWIAWRIVAWQRRNASAPLSTGVATIVVGNLIAGGAGKTPTVRAVVDLLRAAGRQPGIISRGHGRRDAAVRLVQPDTPVNEAGDEPLLLRLRSGAPVAVGRDRLAAARALRAVHPQLDVIVSDDGLQHQALARDAQVIVFDERGVGNGWLLPAGPLREPLPARVPPRTLVLYNADAPSTPLPGHAVQRGFGGVVELARWWAGDAPRRNLPDALRSGPVHAAAGIARPARFFAMLRAAGLELIELPLPDHFDFATLPWPADAAAVVVSEKDAVKLAPARAGAAGVWVATLDFAPDPAFGAALLALLPPHRDGNPPA